MKPLLIWLAIVAVIFGAYALITAAVRDTTQVYVVVDSSFQMRPVWSDVQLELDRIDDEQHAEFALATEKGPVHSWLSTLTLVGVDTFAPCTFEGIADAPEVLEADERILITTSANTCDTSALVDWEIIQLDP
ncbi:MAG: hypothetical protein ABWZ99_07170 [Ilumatobacteraceae bacterium]